MEEKLEENEVVTNDKQYIKGIKIYNIGIKEDPGIKQE